MILSAASFNSYAFWGSDDDSVTIKVSHYFSDSNPQHQALEQFAEELDEKSDGKIKVQLFPNSTLGNEAQSINGVRNGTIEMALIGNLMQQSDPMLGVFEFPFLFRSTEQAKKVLNGEPGKQVKEKYSDFGVHHLAYSISGFRHLTSNKPVNSPEDYKGLRIRVPNNTMFINMAESLGWSVQALPLPEVYTALEQGVVDGEENPYSMIDAQGFYEVQKYIIETGHMFTNLNLIFSQKKWDSLTDEQKKLITEAANHYAETSWAMTTDSVNKIKDKIKASGTEIIIPSEEMVKYNRKSVDGMKQAYIKNNPWAEKFFQEVDAIQ
jgi:tripartite ATP-independent transporter DctP family solute receptor